MSVASYIAYPDPEHQQRLVEKLTQHPNCEVIPAKNAEVFILVTETENSQEERALQSYLQELEGLQGLAMVYGQVDEIKQSEQPEQSE